MANEIPIIKIEDDKDSSLLADSVANKNAIDFTEDISLEQLNDQNGTDNLVVIENRNLDVATSKCLGKPSGVPSSRMEAADLSFIPLSQDCDELCTDDNDESENNTSSDIIVLDEFLETSAKRAKDQWYDEKIDAKQNLVKERFSKLARVLKYSYPEYETCLNRIEETIGTSVCKLEPPRRCPLKEPHINRWKFVCTTKPVMELAESKKDENNESAIKKIETVWRLEPCEGSGVNANNAFQQIPTFVMRAVKIFENFINAANQLNEDPDGIQIVEEKIQNSTTNLTQSITDSKQQWLWLLVRCNNKKEVMIVATGKYIEETTMDALKQLFDTGAGKNCNVKSLYCKSMLKTNDVQTSRTTFLVGSEALDEEIGSLKIQLAPKTNFYLSTSGAEELAKTVESFIAPNCLTTILDVGCGIGLLGLGMASKCHQVIGMDILSEVEEAEMTCELNNITNASFIMGAPNEVMATISNSLLGSKTFAIINANTSVGRNVDIMMGLRKIPTIRRVVMVTTLTKQSVRSILELTRPSDDVLGDPFMPDRAVVVDTVPTGPQFEVVIRMERKSIPKIYTALFGENTQEKDVKSDPKKESWILKETTDEKKTAPIKNSERPIKRPISGRKYNPPENKSKKVGSDETSRSSTEKYVKNPFYEKQFEKHWQTDRHDHSSRLSATSKSSRQNERNFNPQHRRRNEIVEVRSRSPKSPHKRRREWNDEIMPSRNIPARDNKTRDHDDRLRPRSSSNHDESDVLQKMKVQLEVVKKALTGSVDKLTEKQVHAMIDAAIQHTNQVQNHLPRSVWDRIAPPDHNSPDLVQDKDTFQNGRYIKELNTRDIVITAPNKGFEESRDRPGLGKYPNAKILEPNLIMPNDKYIVSPYHRIVNTNYQKQHGNVQNRDKTRWELSSGTRRPPALLSRDHNDGPANKRLQSPPRRPVSPRMKPFSPPHPSRPVPTSFATRAINIRRQVSPPRHYSPPRLSPPRFQTLSPRRDLLPRPVAPLALSESPIDDWDIPSRGAIEQHPNWKNAIDNNRPQYTFGALPETLRKANPMNQNWAGSNSTNKNWNVSSSNSGRDGDGWNNKFTGKKSHDTTVWSRPSSLPSLESRFPGPSVKDPEVVDKSNNFRNESWNDNIKSRWDPQVNKKWPQDKDDWNDDLPEDARDPWGDESGGGSKDRWHKFDNPQPVTWPSTCETKNWMAPQDNWQNKRPQISTNTMKPQWQSNIGHSNQNMGNRWGMATEGPKNIQSSGANWQGNNSWRQQTGFSSGVQPPRNFNTNRFTDGR